LAVAYVGKPLALFRWGGPMIVLRALGVGVVLVLIWQAVVLIFAPPPYLLPPPLAVFAALRDRPDLWRVDAVTTLIETVVGLVIGTAVGAALALVMAFVPVTRRVLLPTMVVSQAIPVFAIAPILALWFGFGITAKVVMATIAIFFPVASAFADGLTRADPGLLDLAALYGARRWQEVTVIRIPSALPGLITGVRLAAVYAPVGALIGEWVGSTSGLGYAMLFANARSETAVVFAALLLIVAMSVLLRAAVDLITANLAPWAPEIH
jgi:putative hydroxymethylpyrimidine transport system permease protein